MVASQRAVTLATERYNRGLTDFLNVVDAERQEYDIEQQYSDAQVSVDEQFIALYRSLGGGWGEVSGACRQLTFHSLPSSRLFIEYFARGQ